MGGAGRRVVRGVRGAGAVGVGVVRGGVAGRLVRGVVVMMVMMVVMMVGVIVAGGLGLLLLLLGVPIRGGGGGGGGAVQVGRVVVGVVVRVRFRGLLLLR